METATATSVTVKDFNAVKRSAGAFLHDALDAMGGDPALRTALTDERFDYPAWRRAAGAENPSHLVWYLHGPSIPDSRPMVRRPHAESRDGPLRSRRRLGRIRPGRAGRPTVRARSSRCPPPSHPSMRSERSTPPMPRKKTPAKTKMSASRIPAADAEVAAGGAATTWLLDLRGGDGGGGEGGG